MDKTKTKYFLLLHLTLIIYSLTGVFSKKAAEATPLGASFFMCYGCVIMLLGIYALFWQQVIKRLPLTTAFANKAITVVWGIIWGMFFFRENISVGKVIGAVLVVLGVVAFSTPEKKENQDE